VLGVGIGMGYVPTELAAPGAVVTIDVRGRLVEAEVTKPPFIRAWQGERDAAAAWQRDQAVPS
jgi:glycine cleavage system aminomethyltransferase T